MRYECPNCKGTDLLITLLVHGILIQDDDGNLQTEITGDGVAVFEDSDGKVRCFSHPGHEWDENSPVRCVDCSWTGTMLAAEVIEQPTVMTQKRYVEAHGGVCPFCGGYEVSAADELRAEYGTAWQGVQCDECGKTWVDEYTLSGFNLE